MRRHNYRLICRLYLACALLAWLVVAMAIERAMTVHKLRSLTETYLDSYEMEKQISQGIQDFYNVNVDMRGYLRDERRTVSLSTTSYNNGN